MELFFSTIGNRKDFTKIELYQPYLRMEVHEDDRQCLTINTTLGLYTYNRLPLSPSLWERASDQVIKGIPGVACYLVRLLSILR